MELKNLIECLIFVSGKGITSEEISTILTAVPNGPQPTCPELQQALKTLQEEWEKRGGGIQLLEVAGGYEFRSFPDYAPWIRELNRPKPQRLTFPSVETLALVAYRQPVTRSDIESVRGVDSGGVLRTLLERRLIRIVGRKEEAGRPLLYATTKEFLELFGLQNLSDLPPLEEFEERIKAEAGKNAPGGEISLGDLISPLDEEGPLEGEDQKVLDQLDESLKDLKEVEKGIQTEEEKPPDRFSSSDVH